MKKDLKRSDLDLFFLQKNEKMSISSFLFFFQNFYLSIFSNNFRTFQTFSSFFLKFSKQNQNFWGFRGIQNTPGQPPTDMYLYRKLLTSLRDLGVLACIGVVFVCCVFVMCYALFGFTLFVYDVNYVVCFKLVICVLYGST